MHVFSFVLLYYSQRPNTAAAAGRSAATTPDDIQYILGVNSIVAIDQVGQQLTLR